MSTMFINVVPIIVVTMSNESYIDPNTISPDRIKFITLDNLRVSTMTISIFTDVGKLDLRTVFDSLETKEATHCIKNKRIGEPGDIVSASYAGEYKGLAAEKHAAKKKPVTETDHTYQGNKGAFGNALDLLITDVTDTRSNINIKVFCNGTLGCVGAKSVNQGLHNICIIYSMLIKISGAIIDPPTTRIINNKNYKTVEMGVRTDMRNHNLTPANPINIDTFIKCIESIKASGDEFPFWIDYNNIINSTLNATWTKSSIAFEQKHYEHAILYWNSKKKNPKVYFKLKKDSSKLPESLIRTKLKKPVKLVIFPTGNSPIIFTGNSLVDMKPALEDFLKLMESYYNFVDNVQDNNVKEPNIRTISRHKIHFTS